MLVCKFSWELCASRRARVENATGAVCTARCYLEKCPLCACFPDCFADGRKMMFLQLNVEWKSHLRLCLGVIFGWGRLGSHSVQSEL